MPTGAQGGPTSANRKQLKNCRKIDGDDPRGPPSEHNMAQDTPKKGLRSFKLGPREAQGPPKWSQGELKKLHIPTGGLTSQKC